MKRLSIFLFFFIVPIVFISAQNSKADKIIEKAIQCIADNKEDKAIDLLKNATIKHSDYAPLYIFLGEIYFNKKDFDNSIIYYNKGVALDKNYDINAFYNLGIMQKKIGDYLNAKRNLGYYVANQHKPRYQSKVEDCKYNIKCIDFIIEQKNNPKQFEPINLGENINDTNDQYLPTLTLDEKLYFTQRENNTEDFWFANPDNSSKIGTNKIISDFVWQKKQKLSSVLNTDANEGAASISPDGRYLYFAKCNTKDGYGSCDIYRSKRIGDKWSPAENLGANVNSRAWDSQPSIASDGRTLFFVSNREGGYGKSDIWYSYLKDDNTWTKAKNCGSTINTGGMEMSPFIHPSNTTLYFASDSLIGMGGEDIYYSKIINGKFQKPVNMGYPINTEADETCFIVSANAQYAVYAKENAENKMDLYAFNLEKELRPIKVIALKGKVIYDDNKKGNEAVIEIKNLTTNKLLTSTISDKITDEFLLTLPCQEDYAMNVTCKGYLLYSENFSLTDDNELFDKTIISKNINLKSIKEGNAVVLNNIFFETNSSELKQESNAELNTLLKLLNDNPLLVIEISGYTDNVGKDDYNINLSKNRAESVRKFLIEKGIHRNRLIAKGYGKANPIADNSTKEGRKKNRRTEFKILKTK